MEHVPFLIAHGPLFWRLLVVALVLAVLGAIWGVRYLGARRAMRDAARIVRRNHGSIRGTLRGGDATTVRVTGVTRADAIGSWRDDSLWLETSERRIEIVGPIQIAVGSHYTASRHGLAVDNKRAEAVISQVPWASKPSAIHSAVAVHLSAGDEIEVRGVIESSASQHEAHPREAAIAWTARGEDKEPLVLAAVSPAPARVPLGLLRTAAVIVATFLVGSFIHRTLGDSWLQECQPDLAEKLDPLAPLELSNGDACVLAASVPKTRERGIYFLHRYLETHPYRDAATVARLDEVAVEAQDCDERLSALFYVQQRYEQVVVEARRCGNPRMEYEALLDLGRFDEAAEVQPLPFVPAQPPLPSPSTLIAAGRWSEAARATRDEARGETAPFQTYRYCVADYLGHLGGDREATARLQKLAAAPQDPDAATCAPVLAVFEPERRVEWIERGGNYYRTRYLLARPSFDVYDADQLLTQPEHPGLHAIALWIPAEPVTAMDRVVAERWRVVKQVLDNDPAGALVRAREVVAKMQALRDADPDREYLYSSRPFDTLIPAVQLYTPTIFDIELPPDPRELWVDAVARLVVRSRRPIDALKLAYSEELEQAFRVAREGDGKAVLELLRKRGSYWYDSDVTALLPHITRDRDVLARELPYLRSSTRMRGDGHIAEDALTAFSRREMFEAAGATEEAARWDAVYRRIDRVLRDDQRRTALILNGR